MWRLKAFCTSKTSNSVAEKKSPSCCRDGLPFTQEWDRLIKMGVSPRELWETRYAEVNRVNSDFQEKMEFKCEDGSKKSSMTPSLASAVEHVMLIFGKAYVQELQGRWEKAQEFGESSAEFWNEELSKFEKKNRWWWRWMGKPKNDDRGKVKTKSSEFDEETLKD